MPSCLCPCAKGLTCWRHSFNIDLEKQELCKFYLLPSRGLLQHCSDKGGSYHSCAMHYHEKLDIKPGKVWIDDSTSDGNQKGADENEGLLYDFVIDRIGDELRSGSLSNAGGSAEFSESKGNAGISGGGIDGESQYLFFIVEC